MKKSLLVILLISIFSNVFAQGTYIKGTVTDETGEVLPGVNIVVKGTLTGTATNYDGNYELRVLEDNPVLVFSFIGYKVQEITVNGQTQIDAVLLMDTENLEEVVVTAQAKGQKNAIRQQINSNTIKNVVAADRLQENPDANAAEAIGRLPGISLMRGGGEGQGIVIRGLSPAYTKVTLNGVEMPSTGDDRSTNISGVSQYMLQGVEVYKAITSNMEADAVAGTINLQLRETPRGFQSKVMAQMGYNDMNSYWGNYKLAGDISKRFFNEKLGVSLSLSAERVMRSTQTMSAGYSSGNSADEIDILLGSINLNAVENIKYRRSAMLMLDYKISPSTILSFYSLYNYSNNDYSSQTKSYGTSGIGSISYGFGYNPYGNNQIWQNVLSARTVLNFMEVDYGVAYSYNKLDDPKSRSWNLSFQKMPTSLSFTEEERRKDPSVLIPLYNDDVNE
ncbi:MAG: TonB-dependent receptor plug domain-containing protein, partial [Draconibacterium sp.]|nr:TonB-dependent receptor plug domain-containing protein [Draconibacterium sp.]